MRAQRAGRFPNGRRIAGARKRGAIRISRTGVVSSRLSLEREM